jgi:hypothetical protein
MLRLTDFQLIYPGTEKKSEKIPKLIKCRMPFPEPESGFQTNRLSNVYLVACSIMLSISEGGFLLF